jgi:hypothetical protein
MKGRRRWALAFLAVYTIRTMKERTGSPFRAADAMEGAHFLSEAGDINGFRPDDLDTPQSMFGLPVSRT